MPLESLLAGLGLIISLFLGIISLIAYFRARKFRLILSAIIFFMFTTKFLIYVFSLFTVYIGMYFLIDVIILIGFYFSLVGRVRSGGESP